MQRSLPRFVRGKGNIFQSLFPSKQPTASSSKLTKEDQDKLREFLPNIQVDGGRKSASSAVAKVAQEPEDILEKRIDEDSIRARGFLKYRYSYSPSPNVEKTIVDIAKETLSQAGVVVSDVLNYKFSGENNEVKYKVLSALGTHFKHWPGNSKLVHFERVSDVVDFYKTPVQNTTTYTQMARGENKPQNVHILEQAVRFHPDDTHLYHGGVTAFPGTGGEVLSLRQKRLLRQFQPKKEWFEYEDQTFDYTRPDKNMPWDPEVARQMDSHSDMRYNLQTKQFKRIKNKLQ